VVPNRACRHALSHDLRQVDRAGGQLDLSGGDPLHVEQLVDEATRLVE